ncbi:hypothetical protein J3B02_002645 [Coemansia erecta]|uniref:GRIP domain-containing protein n=1 Tax=Coemansia asiatica TaxID=1052880 RepID=A0A9W7XJP7_9FUNG|nr:hypothetical protein LPJ64_003682 [Coemansia asiatica]KAJ2854496.1 hypothetical protein J3B02_002645 [Coemansia erecta]KAJ2888689.1 hypothetical protein FB639_000465 [Coemansia asiatica]
MAKIEELQKRVETLQNQLRKAGDHLKRLAAENESLTEQVDKLTEREVQYQKQIEQDNAQENAALKEECAASRLRIAELETQITKMTAQKQINGKVNDPVLQEWHNAANAFSQRIGLSVEKSQIESPGIFGIIQANLETASNARDSGIEDSDSNELIKEMARLRLDIDQERNEKAEMEVRLSSAAELETSITKAVESMASLENLPESLPKTIPEKLYSGLNYLLEHCRASLKTKEQVALLESQLEVTDKQLREATEAREELSKDYDLLLERIGTMKDALKAKMNAESDEVKRLRKENDDARKAANATISQREKTIRELQEAQKALQRELDETKRALWNSQEIASRAQTELTDTASETDRLISDLTARLKAAEERLKSEAALHEQLEDRVEQLQSDLNQALNSESQWVQEREVHLVTIQNLQNALENLQESKDAEVDMAVEKLREELRTRTKEQRVAVARAEKAEGKLRRIELSGATAEQSQQKINMQQAELERLRHEVAVLKDHLSESMRRLREESNEFNLDKRVITNLIVGFLALPYGDSKRYEILQLMSSILQFSEEQQQKVGLIRKAGRRAPLQQQQQQSSGPGTPASESTDTPPLAQLETKESFSDQWISYLLRESSRTRNKRP